jgi:cytochrome c556
MHDLFNHIKKCIKIILFSFLSVFFVSSSNAELTVEEIIKSRQALFSKNYSTAKRVQAVSSKGDFEKAKKLMIEMSENYKVLIDLFPENTEDEFGTEALPTVWEEKDAFNALMTKASEDMIKLISVIEDADDVRGTLKQFMWSNCKACHSRYREPH